MMCLYWDFKISRKIYFGIIINVTRITIRTELKVSSINAKLMEYHTKWKASSNRDSNDNITQKA